MAHRLSDDLTFGEPELSGESGASSEVSSGAEETVTEEATAKIGRRKGLRQRQNTFSASTFQDSYQLTGEALGKGAFASVHTCRSILSGQEFAVKVVEKRAGLNRGRVIKEIETFHLCAGQPNIVQLVEYFEEDDKFFLVFEKMHGGPLLNHIQRRVHFTEAEAAEVVRNIAEALKFLHHKGIAHRDVKPENVLCVHPDKVSPVKLCDLDLASKASPVAPRHHRCPITTPELQSPVGSAEFMAPEVVEAFVGESLKYDKRCDLWSLGVILYISLCGYPPFYGECWRENCGWDRGLPCNDCQDSLFSRIQKGEFQFPSEDWDCVSKKAKDLIQHLLVKDARARYTAEQVLEHPFLTDPAPSTPLQTPDVLLRNDSARDLAQIHENFLALSRVQGIGGSPPKNRLSSSQLQHGSFLPPKASSRKNSAVAFHPALDGPSPGSPQLHSRCSSGLPAPANPSLNQRLSNSSDNGLVVGAV